MDDIERQTAKVVKVRERIARALIRELGVEQSVAESAAEACVGLAFTEKPKAPAVVMPFVRRHYRRALKAFACLCLVCAVFMGVKWFTYDHPQWWATYPREYVVDERWRPTDRSGMFSTNHADEGGGRCLRDEEAPTCLHPNLFPEVTEALSRSVESKSEGVAWSGANGNGELWKIERRRFRFVVTAERDNDFRR
jgi:hypothetical protein